jgi:hypothetical protein
MTWFIAHTDTEWNYTLQVTITHTHTRTHTHLHCCCFVAASNSGCSLSSGFLNCPRPQLPASHNDWTLAVLWLQLKVKVRLWLTVSRPVCLGVKHPYGAQAQIFITVRQFGVCCCGAPSLTRVCVCHFQLLLLSSVVILRSESGGTGSHLRLPQPGGPGTGWPSYSPRCWVPFSSVTHRAMVEVLEPTSTRETLVLLITSRHALRRKRPFHYCCILLLPWKHACLWSHYLAAVVV